MLKPYIHDETSNLIYYNSEYCIETLEDIMHYLEEEDRLGV